MTNRIIQAYRQAPWRAQLQWIGLFLLGLILCALVAAIYLNVSERAALAGREIQKYQSDSDNLERQIADLETQLAMLTSADQMQKRAQTMNFAPIEPGKAMYLVIPGYTERQPVVLAPAPGPSMAQAPLIRTTYTESLWEVLFKGFLTSPSSQTQEQP